MPTPWDFTDNEGSFELPNPQHSSYLYFPLMNESGMTASITPTLNGDLKGDQNTFLLLPTSVEDLHNSRSARNFWVRIDAAHIWSVTGNSAQQTARRFSEDEEAVTLAAGFLWHTITRKHSETGLQAEITNFVPSGNDRVELMRVAFKNTGSGPVTLTPTAAIPIYGRSADDLRDHRHVTSLLHRTTCHASGIIVRPTLSFDERGHTVNRITYAVLGAEADGSTPTGFFPDVETFIGEGGTLDWPGAVVAGLTETRAAGESVEGFEAFGGLRFQDVTLSPGQEKSYVLLLGILHEGETPEALLERYGSEARFAAALEKTKTFWHSKLSALRFETGNPRMDGWLQWVSLQPTLRRLIGNSFLPYHDYGRGGRGWRDLWQDILALLIMETGDVSEMLLGNFAGVRLDGSNATIIGSKPGEFKADRNNIPRVWMDHGAWPLLTTRLYIDQTGDLEFLLREQDYFSDHLTHRCSRSNPAWLPEKGTLLRTAAGEVLRGSVLEHLLIQHLTVFYNVGEHNNILLEGADWNDGLDMARRRGESVAFTALYAGNLRTLAELCQALVERGTREVPLASELLILLNMSSGSSDAVSAAEKHKRLQEYFDAVSGALNGEKVQVALTDLADNLSKKAQSLTQHLRKNEWVETTQGFSWFNGYYDDDGKRVDGEHNGVVHMTLTGQVFTLMCGIASDEQAREIARSADHYLYDKTVGGYRLNTNFGAVLLNLGRAFGFAFGHKENGAMFSHMAVMYANALYRRGLVKEGWKVLEGIYQQSQDFAASRMYPGIPEYFNSRGRGMYTYLTGSASWYLLTMLTEVYGVKGKLGNLVIEPKLTAGQFDQDGSARVKTLFAGKSIEIVFNNPQHLEYNQYVITKVKVNQENVAVGEKSEGIIIQRDLLARLQGAATIHVELSER